MNCNKEQFKTVGELDKLYIDSQNNKSNFRFNYITNNQNNLFYDTQGNTRINHIYPVEMQSAVNFNNHMNNNRKREQFTNNYIDSQGNESALTNVYKTLAEDYDSILNIFYIGK